MSRPQTAEAIAAWAEQQRVHSRQITDGDKSKHGKRLTQQEIAVILQLANAGKTQVDIAAQVGVQQATVSRTLANFSDGRELARKRLEGGALKLAQTVVNTKDSAVALKALGKLDVVREDSAAPTNAFTAVFVKTEANAQLFEPPVIDTFASQVSLSPESLNS